MDKIELNILGCGSALPTTRHYPTSQVLNVRGNLFMIDAGEGAQQQYRRLGLKFSRLKQIFISHLHGDHCFGLFGLLSTLSLLGRTGDLVIHAYGEMEELLRPVMNKFCRDMHFKVIINPLSPWKNEMIYEDRTVKVSTIPLKHGIPTCGFLFEEKQKPAHIIREMIDFYNIPVKEISQIKEGADFITEEGEVVPNSRLTTPAKDRIKYAYCSDTAYSEKIVPIIEGVDLLFHEATFMQADLARAKQTFHSSAMQAAEIAKQACVKKLMIGHYSARYYDIKPLLEEARNIFPETIAAYEGLKINI
ncbi:MAG: ribonuclease Z [Candidatus Azobacteroides sp.]|nr:ribonuclease Z [Candidatus Azobacteroides sp.]